MSEQSGGTIGKKVKALTKQQLWEDAASRAVDALQELADMQSEYQDKKDNMPENLTRTPYGDKLDEITQVDIDSALSTAQYCTAIELPKGFKRD